MPPSHVRAAKSWYSRGASAHSSPRLISQVHVSTVDLAILSTFSFEPIREDMARRGWWDEGAENNNLARLVAFSVVPVIGPAFYLLLRPALED